MGVRAGFAQGEITPPLGAHKIGWIRDIVVDKILDPLYARVAMLESEGERIAFVQLDTLSIRWTQVEDIRRRVAERFGFPGARVMVAATHNHAGPAVSNVGEVRRDAAYLETLVSRVVGLFGEALDNLREAEVGMGSCFEFRVAHNRRVIQRDGTVRTHGSFNDPEALCLEGPIDPEVFVLAARGEDGALLGALVNYACHPTHHGDSTAISAGFPGVLAATMRAEGCPVTLFLNGAQGNVHTSDPCRGGAGASMEEAGRLLAEDARRVIAGLRWRDTLRLGGKTRTLALPYREITPAEVAGTVRGAQRFVDPTIYDRGMPALVERIRTRGSQPAEVQVLFADEFAFAAIPAEYFVQHGLRIKEQAHPRHALVVACANGMVGYVPHREAFARGGYETTLGSGSRLAPEAGDLLADAALALMRAPGP